MSRTYNTIRNSIWGMVNKIIAVLAPFIIRTIIIKELGIDYLGLGSLFTSILQVLNMTELGFSSAIVFSMYKPISENDSDKICALLNLYKKIYNVIGLVILALGLLIMPFIKLVISGTYPNTINIYIVYFLYLINTVISYFLFAYKAAILNANQRNDIISNIMSIILLIQYTIQIIVLIVYKNYYLYYIITHICGVLYNICIAIITKYKYPNYYANGSLSKETLSDIKRRVAGLMVGKICATTRNSFDSIIISMFMGLTIVAIYQNYFYILSNLSGILIVLTTAMSSSIGNRVASESIDKNYKDFNKVTFLYAWISGWFTVCLLCLYQPFIEMWVGTELMFPLYVVICLCIYFYVLTSGDIRSLYMNAAGLWWENRYRSIFEAITNLVLNILLVRIVGISGIILSTIISILIFNFFMSSFILFKHYFKNKNIYCYFISYFKYFMITFIACIITYFLTNYLDCFNNRFVNFAVKVFICIIVPNIIFIIFYHKNENFKAVKEMISKIFRQSVKEVEV